MNSEKAISALARALRGIVLTLLATSPALLHAALPIFWTGPNTNYTQAINTSLPDSIIPTVSIKRLYGGYIFNPAAGETSASTLSPTNTEWATATSQVQTNLSAATNLTFVKFSTWSSGPPYVNTGPHTFNRVENIPAVLHLINENIYISIKITYWGSVGQGRTASVIAYTRSTPAAVLPTPTVSITSPTSGTVFAAPANVSIAANASVSSGSVTNVAFFANGTSVGNDPSAPFSIVTGSLAAGAYSLTAVATAAGVSATSSVVNVTVVAPVATTLSLPTVVNNQFTFDYTANTGLSYVVENSSNLVNWLPLTTNVAAGSPVHFTNSFLPTSLRYFRVGRLP